MTQPGRRIARYRDPKHSGRDPLDHLIMVTMAIAVILVNLVVTVPVLVAFRPAHYDGFLVATLALICATSNLIILRGVSVFGQHVIRRWIFDREQRHHEIVPLTERRPTRA